MPSGKQSAKQAVKCGRQTARCSKLLLRALLSPSLFAYFFWSSLLYLGCGTYIWLSISPVEDYFCSIEPQKYDCSCSDDLILCEKPACWRYAVNLTYQEQAQNSELSYYEAFQEAALDTECKRLIEHQNVEDPVGLLVNIQEAIDEGVIFTQGCRRFHCMVMLYAVSRSQSTDLTGPGRCTNSRGVKDPSEASECPCSSIELSATTAASLRDYCGSRAAGLEAWAVERSSGLCAEEGAVYPWCTPTSPAPTPGLTEIPTASPTSATPSSGRRLKARANAGSNSGTGTPGPGGTGQAAAPPTPLCQDEGVCGSAERRLTNDDNAQDWTVSSWSQCQCLQQCVAGVRTRSVSCPTGTTCKSSVPPAAESCTCWHCARCDVLLVMQAFAIGYWFQGGTCLILWLAFWSVSYMEEDDLSDIRCGMKLLGAICRGLPVIVRTCMFVALVFIIITIFQGFVPLGGLQEDCKTSGLLQVMIIVLGILWIFQLAFGVYMKHYSPMPPWLFNATRSGVLKYLCAPIRAIGP